MNCGFEQPPGVIYNDNDDHGDDDHDDNDDNQLGEPWASLHVEQWAKQTIAKTLTKKLGCEMR